LPWAQLTSLTLDRLNPDACTPILQQTSNLVDCTLSLYAFDYDDGNPPPDVTLPSLNSLTCTDLAIGLYGRYLNTLIVPVLHSLAITEPFLEPNPIDEA